MVSESKEKINHLLFMNDLKLYSQSEKELESLVQIVREVWYRKVCYVSNEERKDCEVSWYKVARW